MIISEYLLLLIPERFWVWYSIMIPVLLLMRYPSYRQRKWQFFYLDFCYYVQVGGSNATCVLFVLRIPQFMGYRRCDPGGVYIRCRTRGVFPEDATGVGGELQEVVTVIGTHVLEIVTTP